MAWKGVPFSFIHDPSTSDLIIALRSLPKIVVDSPPDYTNLVVTALVSLVAGIIPASIAVWTFKRNAENVKAERENQQEFLREEREKQQESLKQDRETQIIIAERNFNMQVLSGNRQSWINSLRDIIAEYTVDAPGLIDATHQYRMQVIYLKNFHKHIEEKSAYSRSDIFNAEYQKAVQNLDSALIKMNERNDKVSLLSSKILMMMNPREDEYVKIKTLFERIRKINSELVNSDKGNELFKKHITETLLLMNDLISLSQQILKREWQRVKEGI
ncbi:hypothetical protein [Pantoea septica]|uniref:hypothetical protein n=1 Tax=Pantoea septica TaxID=472695 RepID=UPI00289ACEFC|nr:hypothetical protein [Pantoea septica]